ncbi:glycophorin-C [Labrus bergylta]|uniref:glycophorin-C n=1 Tax=Labrus bergylta TaxID=56723 RepID=UPI0009B48699|nr:glycophorin-C-like [Labrus bergylta]
MDGTVTPGPPVSTLTEITTSFPKDPTVVTIGLNTADDGEFAALIGGVIFAVLLLLICMAAVLLWCLSRHKGSYATNEMDEDEDFDEDEDEESVDSDTALQIKEPLKTKEEE